MRRFVVFHLIDSLQIGGLETVAVTTANLAQKFNLISGLIVTRNDGPLRSRIERGVFHEVLNRRGRVGFRALRRLITLLREHQVDLLHVHGSSLGFACVAKLFRPRTKIVWHVHFGRYASENRRSLSCRLFSLWCDAIVSVSQPLQEWVVDALAYPRERSHFIPNCVAAWPLHYSKPDLPGTPGSRICCLANLREEKDQLTLIRAMAAVTKRVPDATLLLVGGGIENAYGQKLVAEVAAAGLESKVHFLGQRPEVIGILDGCDIGVLSSMSEGLPLAVLEYGQAGLPVVATDVGQVAEVLGHGDSGKLVPCRDPAALAERMVELLENPELRTRLGISLRDRVTKVFGEETYMRKLREIYKSALGNQSGDQKY